MTQSDWPGYVMGHLPGVDGQVSKMKGMIPNLLRGRGFNREKGDTVYTRHTVGVGGVYVYFTNGTVRVKCKELRIDQYVDLASELRVLLDHIDMSDRVMRRWWTGLSTREAVE